MARTFITKADIDHLVDAGQEVLEVDDSITVTDVARDQALQRGVRIVRRDTPTQLPATGAASGSPSPPGATPDTDRANIRRLVITRLGSEPDDLDAAIDRALGERSAT